MGSEKEETAPKVAVIAKPLADSKLTKKIYKLIKRAAKAKQVKRGVKEVVKAIRKKNKGVVVLAGNISPIDVISHLPVLCEDADIPYIYVPSKEDLGAAAQTKRPTSCMLILAEAAKKDNKMSSEDEKKFKEEYDTVLKKVKASEMVFSNPSTRQ